MGLEHMPIKLSREMLAQSRVIAKGRAIRDLDRLLRQYGGRAKHWVKKSTAIIWLNGRRAEVHWYEHRGIGRVELKVKWIDAP